MPLNQLKQQPYNLYEFFKHEVLHPPLWAAIWITGGLEDHSVAKPKGEMAPQTLSELKSHLSYTLDPYRNMWKDLKRTVKRYKTGYHMARDAFSVIEALINLVLGLVHIALAPLIFVVGVILSMPYSIYLMLHGEGKTEPNPLLEENDAVKELIGDEEVHVEGGFKAAAQQLFIENGKRLGLALAYMFHGVNLVVRGATQALAYPLTLVKIALRSLMTALWGWQTFHENPSVQRLANQGMQSILDNKGNERFERNDDHYAEHMATAGLCMDQIFDKFQRHVYVPVEIEGNEQQDAIHDLINAKAADYQKAGFRQNSELDPEVVARTFCAAVTTNEDDEYRVTDHGQAVRFFNLFNADRQAAAQDASRTQFEMF